MVSKYVARAGIAGLDWPGVAAHAPPGDTHRSRLPYCIKLRG
jgi:hypothetical protein